MEQTQRYSRAVGHELIGSATSGPGRRRLPERLGGALVRARVLLSSYAPLNLILFWRVDPTAPKFVCLGLAVVGFLDGLRLTSTASAGERACPTRAVGS
jgi:hypothetical protein